MTFLKRLRSTDVAAVTVLTLLWWLFFWRLFTPTAADQVSLQSGDFSGQFIAFAAYQYERLASGEFPLWNPYNNGGLPFVADTQAAAFYPPRLLTMLLSKLSGGWTYNALQLEMTAHILVYTLLMYSFVRRLTAGGGNASVIGSFVAAVIAGYGGFMSGYPPLQLALLEAAIWLPLALIGILEGTHATPSALQRQQSAAWLILAGFALGLSWMAGHPQTSLLATYLAVAYLGFRVYIQKHSWWVFIAGTVLIGAVTLGISAVQFLPGIEYLTHTMRGGFGFDAKAGGFPVQDLAQLLFPGVVSLWSPLFIGVSGLILVGIGMAGQAQERCFWGMVALLALGLSLGGNSVLYHAAYNLLPGIRFFRGQERAAYLVANSLAILAGLGAVALLTSKDPLWLRRIRFGATGLLAICMLFSGGVFVLWLGNREAYGSVVSPVLLSTVIAAGFLAIISAGIRAATPVLIAGLVVFELFSINIDGSSYEPIPASQQPIMKTPPLVERVKSDTEIPFRVDGGLVRGRIGIYGNGNTGSLYGIADIRGISPLFLDGPHAIIQRELPSEIAWELFAVRYIFTDAEELVVPSELIARDYPEGEVLNLYRLTDPRPFAHLAYDYVVADSDAAARALLANPDFDPRHTVILRDEPGIPLPSEAPVSTEATITDYAPEHFTVQVKTTDNAILSVALVDYPGWKVWLDNTRVGSIRAYGALTAVPLPAGEHQITFQYDPISFKTGAVLSLLAWAGAIVLGTAVLIRTIPKTRSVAQRAALIDMQT